MEEIIKAFNAEKKFLKRNVKKIELINKIREKFDSIFHFVITTTPLQLSTFLTHFPNLTTLPTITLPNWPAPALHTFASARLDSTLVEAAILIDSELKSRWPETANYSCTHLLSILNHY